MLSLLYYTPQACIVPRSPSQARTFGFIMKGFGGFTMVLEIAEAARVSWKCADGTVRHNKFNTMVDEPVYAKMLIFLLLY